MKILHQIIATVILSYAASYGQVTFRGNGGVLDSIEFTSPIQFELVEPYSHSTPIGVMLVLNDVYSQNTFMPHSSDPVPFVAGNPPLLLNGNIYSVITHPWLLWESVWTEFEDVSRAVNLDPRDLLIVYNPSYHSAINWNISDIMTVEKGTIITSNAGFTVPMPDKLGTSITVHLIDADAVVGIMSEDLSLAIIPESSETYLLGWVCLLLILAKSKMRGRISRWC